MRKLLLIWLLLTCFAHAQWTWQGTWSSATAYVANNVVFYSGSTYLCLVGNTNVTPPSNTTDWALVAQAGTAGAPGAAATVSIGSTATGPPLTNAAVANTGSSSAAVLNFTLPQGASSGVQAANNGSDFSSSAATAENIVNGNPISPSATNNTGHAEEFPGATADLQIIACLAAYATCDATGYGFTTQTIASTVEIGIGSFFKRLILSPNTLFEPLNASTPAAIFKVDRNGQLEGAHIVLQSGFVYAGKAIDIEDTIIGEAFSGSNSFAVNHIIVDGSQESGTSGYCMFVQPPSGTYVQLITIDGVTCNNTQYGLYLSTTGASAYINGNTFTNFVISNNVSGANVYFNAGSGTLGMDGNTFKGFQLENGGCGISYNGSAQINANTFIGSTNDETPICNNNSSATLNTFIGYMDQSYSDTKKNSYYVNGALSVPGNDATLTTNPGNISSTSFTSTTLVLPTVAPNSVRNGECDLIWLMADSSHAMVLGFGMSNSPTYLIGYDTVLYTAAGAQTEQVFSQTATTPTAISQGTIPATSSAYGAEIKFSMQAASNPVVLTLYAEVSSGGLVNIGQGSHCYWVP